MTAEKPTTTPLPQMLAEALGEAGFGFDRPGGYAAQAAALLATPALARWVALVEAAEAWRDARPRYNGESVTLLRAVDAFRGSPDR